MLPILQMTNLRPTEDRVQDLGCIQSSRLLGLLRSVTVSWSFLLFRDLDGGVLVREQPIFTTRAHVFQIDPSTKKNWVPASKQAVTVSYFYDVTRNSYRIISVDGAKVIINSTITPNMTFTKTSQKFGQWADSRANTVFGLGFSSEQQLTKVTRSVPGGRGCERRRCRAGFLSSP